MSDNTISTRSDGQTVQSDDVNQFVTALGQDVVPRNSTGVPTNEAGSLGTSILEWKDIHFSGNLVQDGNVIALSQLTGQSYQIVSGKARTSGYPDFLSAGPGAQQGQVLATSTNLSVIINQTSVTVTADLTVSGLTLAPSTNNTCLINYPNLAGQESSKWLGEEDSPMPIDTIGTGISGLDGTIQVFKTGSEYFLALVDTTNNQLWPFRRAVGLSPKSTLSDNDTITLMQGNYVFLAEDGSTLYTTTIFPLYQNSDPASGTSGQFYFNVETKTWRQYTAAWNDINVIFLGYFICDDASCVAAQSNDFFKFWNDTADGSLVLVDNATIRVNLKHFNVAAQEFILDAYGNTISTGTSGDFESGDSLTANTTYYLYVDTTLKTVFSTTPPRPYENRKGWYHPHEYWRFIGFCETDASSHLTGVYWMPQRKEGQLIRETQEFTSSGTHVQAFGTRYVYEEVQGGGGGAGAKASTVGTSGAGGAGGYSAKTVFHPGIIEIVTVGTGGSGGSAGGNNGSSGGTSSYGSWNSATGGGGGIHTASSKAGGAGGTGSGGDLNIDGQAGEHGSATASSDSIRIGKGGDSQLGKGGLAKNGNGTGFNATGYGSGGGSACDNASSSWAGGNGSDGIVNVKEYL